MENNYQIRFISEIYELQKKNIPNFKKLNENEINSLYSETLNNTNDLLLRSRQIPIEKDYLDGLYKLSCSHKSTAIILNSMRS